MLVFSFVNFLIRKINSKHSLIGLKGHVVMFFEPTPDGVRLQSPFPQILIFELFHGMILDFLKQPLKILWAQVTMAIKFHQWNLPELVVRMMELVETKFP